MGTRTLPPKPQIDPASLYSDPNLGDVAGGAGGYDGMMGGTATNGMNINPPRSDLIPQPQSYVRKPQIDPDSLFSDPGLGGGPVPRPGPAPRVDNPRVMPAPVPGPAPVVPSAPSGDFQSNVDFMNQMATTVSYTHLTLPTKRIV